MGNDSRKTPSQLPLKGENGHLSSKMVICKTSRPPPLGGAERGSVLAVREVCVCVEGGLCLRRGFYWLFYFFPFLL